MKKLKVDLNDLEMAFETRSGENSCFLDLETGKVIWVTDETNTQLEMIFEEAYDPESEDEVDLAEILQGQELPDWQVEALLDANVVELGFGSRYVAVPESDSRAGYRDMERFIPAVEDAELRDRLWRAIEGRGAFRYFKDVLTVHPRERERWFAYKDRQEKQRMLDWLQSQGIEPILPPNSAGAGT